MRQLTFRLYFKRSINFDEHDFIEFVKNGLNGLYVKKIVYCDNGEYFTFQLTYENVIPLFMDYRPILGFFSCLEQEYAAVSNISIPNMYMDLKNV